MSQQADTPFARDRVWRKAAAYAARMHANHARKDGRTPYFSHPARVAMTVRDTFGLDDADAIAAAFLHDTIEDTPADYDDIADRFGTAVADLVAALTKNMLLPEPEREADYDQRLASADWRARLVKLADVLDNAEDMHTRPDGNRADVCRRNDERIDRILKLTETDTHDAVVRARSFVAAARSNRD
ncbi:MAG: HD domain-containing protein [Planctomycetota bacterium]